MYQDYFKAIKKNVLQGIPFTRLSKHELGAIDGQLTVINRRISHLAH